MWIACQSHHSSASEPQAFRLCRVEHFCTNYRLQAHHHHIPIPTSSPTQHQPLPPQPRRPTPLNHTTPPFVEPTRSRPVPILHNPQPLPPSSVTVIPYTDNLALTCPPTRRHGRTTGTPEHGIQAYIPIILVRGTTTCRPELTASE
jgi:hypothetical protein